MKLVFLSFISAMMVSGNLLAADIPAGPFVYPKNGQGPEQQMSDTNSCRAWAQQQTGIDPAYLQGQLSMAKSQAAGGASRQMPVARGALRGVAAGTALGAINSSMDDGAGKGAALGVTAGAMRGVGQRIDNARAAQAQQSQKQIQNLQNEYSQYNRAFSACMDAKGYSVS
jgi:hypothetical protein